VFDCYLVTGKVCVVNCQRLSQRYVVDYLLVPSMVVVRKIEVQYLKIVFLVIKKCDYLVFFNSLFNKTFSSLMLVFFFSYSLLLFLH
jgi:hypothetical protein